MLYILPLTNITVFMSPLPSVFEVTFKNKSYTAFYIDNLPNAKKIMKQLQSKHTLMAFDTETAALPQYKEDSRAGLSPYLSTIRLLQCFTGTGAVVFDLHKIGPGLEDDIKTLFTNRPTVAHNAIFDLKFLMNQYGVKLNHIECTCIMARLIFHALYPGFKSAALDSVAVGLFGEEVLKTVQTSDWSAPQLTFEQIEYAALDAVIVYEIFLKLRATLFKLNLTDVYRLYRDAQHPLAEMELTGIGFDTSTHLENVAKWQSELYKAKQELMKITHLTGITSHKMAKYLEQELPSETLEIWPRTDAGKLKTDAHTLADFDWINIVEPFSKFQKLEKLCSSFGENLASQSNPATNKIHPGYIIAGAVTGRLSCASPNLQQMPQDLAIRNCFTADAGKIFVMADYSLIELRVIAEFSQDEEMIKAYESGFDIYVYVAARLNNKRMADVTDSERQHAKALCLGLNYGLGATKFKHYAKKNYKLQLTDTQSFESIQNYRELFSGLRKWQMKQVQDVENSNYTAYTHLGKCRKMTHETFYGGGLNHPIQGTSAEILLRALVTAQKEFIRFAEHYGVSLPRLVATIHDEIIVQCDPQDGDRVQEILAKCMVDSYLVTFPESRTHRDLVEPITGISWGDAKSNAKKRDKLKRVQTVN